MLWPKKHSRKEFDSEKNSFSSKIPLPSPSPSPSHNFSNGPSLRQVPQVPDPHPTLYFHKPALNLLPKEPEHSGSQACPILR